MIRFDGGNTDTFLKESVLEGSLERGLAALDEILARRGPGREMLGWLDLPGMPDGGLRRIEDTAARIRDENDCLVVVGIGGSYLGARAAIDALPEEALFPVLFAGHNLSSDYHARLLDELENRRYALCVISKSGTTTEPAIAFRILERRLVERLGRSEASKRIIAVTDPAAGALRSAAEREGFAAFAIPPDVGGRYSVLSPVGLVPCAAAGIPVRDLLRGAAEAMDRCTRRGPGNEAVQYAARRSALFEGGTAIEVLSTFNPELDTFCEWWKQLAGESEGKEGKGLFPASAVMTTDLHSLGQYLQEGPRHLLETCLVADEPRRTVVIPPAGDDRDGLEYLAGRTMSEINEKAFEGTRAAHQAGGLPVMTIELPAVTPAAIGALFVFFEIAVAVSGRILGINPFDQPGVDEYKRRMFDLLGKPGSER
ncbi:MAG TPA: glucose-6-phosphate isomerase [Candidatus Eisenbacteria bacterium]|uniref:Glucose-6-phosphate isomerase n=1 Tax=Eiseniibacteriota bacterium TaxID=2212470 RepID=A0A7V2AVC8_UNCEI|nr:glucose-6-phosphate isomerase [Candidatus Eisenbacteria bacterium]